MNHREAFIQVKKFYGIENKALHLQSGVSLGHISKFINYKQDMTSASLDKLINAMDELIPGAKRYYCGLLLGESLVNTREAARNMSFKDMANMMSAMADALEAAGETELMVS